MEPHEIEGEAAHLYDVGQLDPEEAPGGRRLAARILGVSALRFVDGRFVKGGDAALGFLAGLPFICVRKGLPAHRIHFAIAHEIAEWHLRAVDYREPDREHVADGIAAALIVPPRALRAAAREHGREAWSQLALDFEATETCIALRVGEVLGSPLVVVTPALVRVRGVEWCWPDEQELRRLARGPSRPGLRKAKLTDDSRRVVLAGSEE